MDGSATTRAKPTCALDLPKGGVVNHPIDHIWGWVEGEAPPNGLAATVEGVDVPCATIKRGKRRVGYSVYVDLSRLPEILSARPANLPIDLSADGQSIVRLQIAVDAIAYDLATEVSANRCVKAAFVHKHAPALASLPGVLAPVALPKDWTLSPLLKDKKDGVSSHFYSADMRSFLGTFTADQFVLDAGAGLRKRPYRNVVNMEIYDYPSTDLIGVGQALPFKDNTFDGVISMAVLEHVENPQACASEIIRVMKPHGRVYVGVPFLQPEHGYPSHYFNCTRFGLRKLFEGAELVEHKVPDRANHPIMALYKLATVYSAGLQGKIKDEFLDLTIRDLICTSPDDLFASTIPFVAGLDETARWRVACGTTAIFAKP